MRFLVLLVVPLYIGYAYSCVHLVQKKVILSIAASAMQSAMIIQ
jgi:hypothetical protein